MEIRIDDFTQAPKQIRLEFSEYGRSPFLSWRNSAKSRIQKIPLYKIISTWMNSIIQLTMVIKKASPSPKKQRDKNPELAIVIPTYNERENIEPLLAELSKLYRDALIYIVDDNSPDGTGRIVEKVARKNKRIHLIKRSKKEGIGLAYRHGFKEALKAHPNYIVQMDADFSHDPSKIKAMLEEIKEADLVIGSRYIKGVSVVNWPLKRVLMSWSANYFVRKITQIPILDTTAGFKCYRRKTLEAIHLDKVHSDGYCFQIEMNYLLFRFGFRVKEIPIIFVDRHAGSSKLNAGIVMEGIWKVLFMPFRRLDIYRKR